MEYEKLDKIKLEIGQVWKLTSSIQFQESWIAKEEIIGITRTGPFALAFKTLADGSEFTIKFPENRKIFWYEFFPALEQITTADLMGTTLDYSKYPKQQLLHLISFLEDQFKDFDTSDYADITCLACLHTFYIKKNYVGVINCPYCLEETKQL